MASAEGVTMDVTGVSGEVVTISLFDGKGVLDATCVLPESGFARLGVNCTKEFTYTCR